MISSLATSSSEDGLRLRLEPKDVVVEPEFVSGKEEERNAETHYSSVAASTHTSYRALRGLLRARYTLASTRVVPLVTGRSCKRPDRYPAGTLRSRLTDSFQDPVRGTQLASQPFLDSPPDPVRCTQLSLRPSPNITGRLASSGQPIRK